MDEREERSKEQGVVHVSSKKRGGRDSTPSPDESRGAHWDPVPLGCTSAALGGQTAIKAIAPGVAAPVVTVASQEVGLGLALLTGV